MSRNPYFTALKEGYLFPEITRRKELYLSSHPDAQLISLGIGDATEPLTPTAVTGLAEVSLEMGTEQGYQGYGPEQGLPALRKAIATTLYNNCVEADEIYISDGAKCDVGRLQLLFSSGSTVAIQDPVYPVYRDTSILTGKKVVTMACSPECDYFPESFPKADIMMFCSPNNPTGAVATHEQLERLVEAARVNKSIIIFDAAYSAFIQGDALPRSIYEIEGAKEVAIEINSFSKSAGFTGVRLGWSVVPKELKFQDGTSVQRDWSRVVATFFNGASVVTQRAACNLLTDNGLSEITQRVAFYLENATIIANALDQIGWRYDGGRHIPYLWVKGPDKTSWEIFDLLLHEAGIVSVPGSGFGPAGEGFIRLSAFGHRPSIVQAAKRLGELYVHNHTVGV